MRGAWSVPLSIYREAGLGSLVTHTSRYAANYAVAKLVAAFTDEFMLCVGDTEVVVPATSERILRHLRWAHRREERWIEYAQDALKPDDVFFDIGANLGIYTLFAVQSTRGVSAVAFEPYEPNVVALEQIFSNRHDVRIVPKALSNQQGTAEFSQPDKRVGSQVGSFSTAGGDSTVTVSTETVDGLVSAGDVAPPNVVKIDVEGAESVILEGMQETLERHSVRTVLCEVHYSESVDTRPSVEQFGSSVEKVVERLEAAGFDVELFDSEVPLEGHVVATDR